MMSAEVRKYNFEDRLIEYAAQVIRLTRTMANEPTSRHISHQLMRSATSPMANHGEAQSAESDKDFSHKLSISLKELRESHRWLKLIQRVPLPCEGDTLAALLDETDQLERIFNSSIKTTRQRINATQKGG